MMHEQLYNILGFSRIREKIASYTISENGRKRAFILESFLDETGIALNQSLVLEMRELILLDSALSLIEFSDQGTVLKRVSIPGSVLSEEELYDLAIILSKSRSVLRYFTQRKEKYPALERLAENGISDLHSLSSGILGIFNDDKRIKDTASSLLHDIRRKLQKLQQKIYSKAQKIAAEAVEDQISDGSGVAYRGGRLVIPVRASRKNKIPGIIHDQSQTGQTFYIEPMIIVEYNNELRQLQLEEQEEIHRILAGKTDDLRTHLDDIYLTIDTLEHLDLLFAEGQLAAEYQCEVPLREKGQFRIKEGRNLELEFQRKVVPLDIHFEEDKKGIVITGPNAGGKTVTLKTIGLIALMNQAGLLIPADSVSSLPYFDSIFVDIGDGQSIDGDLSTFSSHILKLKDILDNSTEKSLVLLDELGTGTDPDEGAALAEGILDYLMRNDTIVFATTHHSALKTFAYESEKIMNGSMSFNDKNLAPTYEFKLGIPGSSYALEIAKRYHINESVLNFAKKRIGKSREKLEKLITDLQRKIFRYDQQLKSAKELERTLKEKVKYIESQKKEIDHKYKKAEKEALKKADGFIQSMYSEFEKTIQDIKTKGAGKEAIKQSRAVLKHIQDEVVDRKSKLELPKKHSLKFQDLSVGMSFFVSTMGQNGNIVELNKKTGKIWVDINGTRLRVTVDWLEPASGKKQKVSTNVSFSRQAQLKLDIRGYRLHEAKAEIEKFIDSSILSGLSYVEILHGTGDGVLRKAINDILPSDPRVRKFRSAPWNQGGAGVTMIDLKN